MSLAAKFLSLYTDLSTVSDFLIGICCYGEASGVNTAVGRSAAYATTTRLGRCIVSAENLYCKIQNGWVGEVFITIFAADIICLLLYNIIGSTLWGRKQKFWPVYNVECALRE